MPQVVLSPPLNVSRNQVNLVKVMLQLLQLLHLLKFSTSVTRGPGGENTERTVKKNVKSILIPTYTFAIVSWGIIKKSRGRKEGGQFWSQMKRRQSQTCVRSSHCLQSKLQTRKGKKTINILFEVEWLGRWCFDFIEKSIHAIILWPPPMILVTMSYNNSMMVISMLTLHYHQRCADGHLDPRRRDRAWDCSCRPEDLCCCWGAMIMMI